MIKRFKDLNEEEIKAVKIYLNKIKKNNKSEEEIKKEFNEKIYGYGEGVLYSIRRK